VQDATRHAHTLKGASAALSAEDLSSAAAALEEALVAGRAVELPMRLGTLEKALDLAIDFAKVWMAELAHPDNAAGYRPPQAAELAIGDTADPELRPAVLLVEDDAATLDLLDGTFSPDYNLLFATNGECAIELALLKTPDLVLLDITLPGIDGFEVCRRLKQNPKTMNIPVIFITGAHDTNSEIAGLSSGAVDYVTKPIQPGSVRERVRNQIKLKRAQDRSTLAAAHELAYSRAHLNSVLDSTSEGVLEVSPQWSVLYANRRALALLEDLKLGDDLWSCFPALCTTPVQQSLREAMVERRDITQETYYAPGDRWYRFQAFPLSDGMSIFFRDTTAEKNMERQLSIEQLLKEKRAEALGHMAAGLAHEINNPLAIIHALANDVCGLLNNGVAVSVDDMNRACEKILSSSDRAMKSQRGFLGFAGESRKDPMHPAAIHKLIDECVDWQQERCERHAIDLRMEISGPIPMVVCREVQIEQILINLISNAIDAIVQSNASERWILVQAERLGNNVSVDVIDSGPGISEDIKAHLMEPFFSTKPAGDGMGIGLSLSRLIAEDHNGSLSLRERGGHTCFRLLLPVGPGVGMPAPTQRLGDVRHEIGLH
jgi:signal transduction histidine kinase